MATLKERVGQLRSLVTGAARATVSESRYGIRRGYRHRTSYTHFSDAGSEDRAQKEVYQAALRLAREHGCRTLVDVGCGSGFKLVEYLSGDLDTTGVDIRDTFAYLQATYPEHRWLDGEQVDFATLSADMVVCADVIEHVVDPDALLDNILSIQGLELVVLSTPDRLLARGWHDFGPPKNPTHVREWNGYEFARYISGKLDVLSHEITRYDEATQMIVGKPRGASTSNQG